MSEACVYHFHYQKKKTCIHLSFQQTEVFLLKLLLKYCDLLLKLADVIMKHRYHLH